MHKLAKQDLLASGIGTSQAKELEMYSVTDASTICPHFPKVPALIIQYVDPETDEFITYVDENGETQIFCRAKLYHPKSKTQGFTKQKGPPKYLQPPGSPVEAYFPPVTFEYEGEELTWDEVLDDPDIPIMIVEGEKKAAAGCATGMPVIGLGGVNSFLRNHELLPVLADARLAKRDIYICFDSDALDKPAIQIAEGQLSTELGMKRNANVFLIRLPDLKGGAKQGLDDFLVANKEGAIWDLVDKAQPMRKMDKAILNMNLSVVWVEKDALILDTSRDIWMKKADFKEGSIYSTEYVESPSMKGDKVVRQWVAAEWIKHPLANRVDDTVFAPWTEEKYVRTRKGLHALNRYHGLPTYDGKVRYEDVEPFFDLHDYLMTLTPEFEDQDLLWKIICYKLQNLGEKIPLGIMLLGDQGSGKTLFCDIIREMFGEHGVAKSSSALGDDFNGWIETALLCVMNEAEEWSMVRNLQTLKRFISDKHQDAKEKYRVAKQVESYTFYMFTSNQQNAGAFSNDDRRMIVTLCPDTHPDGDGFYEPIFKWFDNGGPAKLAKYMMEYDLEGWKPPRHAPATYQKRAAWLASLTPIDIVATEIRDGKKNVVSLWIKVALDWAVTQDGSTFAADVAQTLPTIQIRPWYTANELSMLMPIISTDMAKAKHRTKGDPLMQAFMQAGIRFLRNVDHMDGFMWKGKRRQFFLISRMKDFADGITQEEFEEAMAGFPTYKEKVDAATKRTKAERRKSKRRGR